MFDPVTLAGSNNLQLWQKTTQASAGKLIARSNQPDLGNQLYRIKIHQGGDTTAPADTVTFAT